MLRNLSLKCARSARGCRLGTTPPCNTVAWNPLSFSTAPPCVFSEFLEKPRSAQNARRSHYPIRVDSYMCGRIFASLVYRVTVRQPTDGAGGEKTGRTTRKEYKLADGTGRREVEVHTGHTNRRRGACKRPYSVQGHTKCNTKGPSVPPFTVYPIVCAGHDSHHDRGRSPD